MTMADPITSAGVSDFNPHEREARDRTLYPSVKRIYILIHTSVKLVTLDYIWSSYFLTF